MGTTHKNLTLDEIHVLVARVYANITARDADTTFNTTATNVNKVVRVDLPLAYYILKAITPAWESIGASLNNEFTELTDTPSSYSGAGSKVVEVNSGATALQFGQILTSVGTPTFSTLTSTGTITGPSGTWDSGGMDIATGDTYAVNSVDVLSATTLGSSVVSSSLTSVGTLTSLTIAGDLTVDTTTLAVNSTLNKVGVGVVPTASEGQFHVTDGTVFPSPSTVADTAVFSQDGDSGISIFSGLDQRGAISFGDTAGSSQGSLDFRHASNSFEFFTEGSLRVTLNSSGLGIGISPSFPLHVNGDARIVGGLVVDTDTLTVDSTLNRVVIGSTDTALTDLTIFQGANNFKGLTLSGQAVAGSSTTEGVSVLYGNSAAGNNQVWFVNTAELASVSANSLVISSGLAIPRIFGVSNDGASQRHIGLGTNMADLGVAIGFAGVAVQADVDSKLHVRTGVAAEIGLIVQGETSQTGDLVQLHNAAGTTIFSIDSAGQIDATTQKIVNVVDPTLAQDAATKNYTDTNFGNVANTGTPLDNQIAVWTAATVIEGTTGLTYDGTTLEVTDGTVFPAKPGFANEFAIAEGGNCGMVIYSANNQVGHILFGDTDGADRGRVQYSHANEALSFFTEGAFRVDVNSTGLGIGVSPSVKLHSLSTTEQLRLGFDALNFSSFTVSSGGDLTIAPTGNDTNVTGDLTISGDLTVSGTTTTIDTTTLLVEDKNIEIGNVTTPTNITADGGGITLKGATDKTITWVNATGAWTFNQEVDLLANQLFVNNISGDVATQLQIESLLDLRLIANTNVNINGIGITLTSTTGLLQLDTTSANIDLKTTGGAINLLPTTGAVNLTTTTGNIALSTSTGDISVEPGTVNPFTISGDVMVTGSGNVTIQKLGTGPNAGVLVSSGTAGLAIRNTLGAVDNKIWGFTAFGASSQFRMQASNDAGSSNTSWLTVDRTGVVIDDVNFPQGTVNISNNLSVTGAFLDTSGDVGTNGQVLSSTVTGTNWITPNTGDVVGPASSTDNAIARFNLTTGKLLQNSGVLIDDSNNLESPGTIEGGNLTAIGTTLTNVLTVTGTATIADDFTIATSLLFADVSNGTVTLGNSVTGTDRFNVFIPDAGVQTGIATFYDSASAIKFRLRDQLTASSIPPRIEGESSLGMAFNTTLDAPFIWYVNGTSNEEMRLSSTGLGVGTTPATKLHTLSTAADTTAITTTESTGTNGGTTKTYVTSRDPNANITGSGGEIAIRDSADTSDLYINRAATTGTVWGQVSSYPPLTFEINTDAQWAALFTAGSRTVSVDTTIRLNINVSANANVFVLSGGVELSITGGFAADVGNTYNGTGTFVSGNGVFRNTDRAIMTSTSTGTFVALTGGNCVLNNNNGIGWQTLGTIDNARMLIRSFTFRSTSASTGFVITNPSLLNVLNCAHAGTQMAGAFFTIKSNSPSVRLGFNTVSSNTTATGSILDFDTRMDNSNSYRVVSCTATGSGNVFKQAALADATINSVADGSIAAGTITAQADNGSGGTTHSCTTTYFEDEEVTISGTTSYNGTFQIFNVVAGVSFDTITTFVANDATGSVATERLTLTLSAASVAAGESIKVIDTDFYNAFYTALSVTGAVVTVNGTFIVTDTGTVKRDIGLDATDPRILASDNKDAADFSLSDAQILAFGFTNANATATTITDGTYAAINVAGFDPNPSTERFKLTNATNGIFELTALQDLAGFMTGSLSALKTGSTANYRFAMSTNGVAPTFATANYIPMEVKTTKVNIALEFIVDLVKGDTIQIMAAGDGTSDNLTITDLVFGIK